MPCNLAVKCFVETWPCHRLPRDPLDPGPGAAGMLVHVTDTAPRPIQGPRQHDYHAGP